MAKVFDMAASGTGLTEAQLRAAGIGQRKVCAHPSGHAAYYPGTAPLFMKVLFDPAEGRLLGAQVLGWRGRAHRRPRGRPARRDLTDW